MNLLHFFQDFLFIIKKSFFLKKTIDFLKRIAYIVYVNKKKGTKKND